MTAVSRIRNNSFYLLLLTISNYFVGLLVFPHLSRVLTVESFGVVGFAMMYTLIFQSAVEYGFMISATADISRNRDNSSVVSRLVTDVMATKVVLLALSLSAFLVSALFVEIVRDNLLFLVLFFCSSVTAALVPDFYFRGIERMRTVASRSLVSRLLSVALIVVVVRSDADRLWIPTALFLGNLIAMLWSFASMRRFGFRSSQVLLSKTVYNLRNGFLYFLSRIAATINQAAGAFVLSLVFSGTSHELGLYAAAWRIASAGEMLLIPVADSLYPHMVKEGDYRLFWKVYFRGLLVWFVGCAIVFAGADVICAIILGQDYTEAGGILRVLIIGAFLAYSSIMFGYNALSPIGLAWHANMSLLFSLAINIAALSALLFTNNANVWTVSVVVACTNLNLILYRGFVLFRFRDRIGSGHPASGRVQQ